MTTAERPPLSAGIARWTCPICGQTDDESSRPCVSLPIEEARRCWPVQAVHDPAFHEPGRASIGVCGDCADDTPLPHPADLADVETTLSSSQAPDAARNTGTNDGRCVIRLPLAAIRPSELNPRRRFDPAALSDLAESIRKHGLLEPLVVRQVSQAAATAGREETHELVAGERRWRACQIAGVAAVDTTDLGAISDAAACELALIENIARHDLDPIEEAEGYRALNRIAGLTQAEIAGRVNREQPAIAKMIGLLDLPEDVQERIRSGELTVGHGVALRKHHQFPAVCSVIAQWAVEQQKTTKALEAKTLLDDYTLRHLIEEQGLGTALAYGTAFDTAICRQCPYSAYRATSYGAGFCLKPDHYATLETAARELKEVETKAALARQDGKALPKLDTLRYDAYEHVTGRAPSGCTDACPCRGQALDHDRQVVAICTDPKRWRGLQGADTREQKRQAQERYERDMAALKAHLAVQPEVDTRGLALVVAEALRGTDSTRRAVAHEVAAWAGISFDVKKLADWNIDFGLVDQLATLTPSALVRLAVGILIGAEIKSESSGYHTSDKRHWYLHDAEGAEGAEGAEVAEVADEAKPVQQQ